MFNNQGKYVLACNFDYYNEISNIKLERIVDIEILDTDVKPITKLKGYEKGLDIAKYVNENFYTFGTKTIKAKLKIYTDWALAYVDERFGKDVKFSEESGVYYATVQANESSIMYWCLQYGEAIELLEPEDARERIKKILGTMSERYKD